jgi:hypothetical protein
MHYPGAHPAVQFRLGYPQGLARCGLVAAGDCHFDTLDEGAYAADPGAIDDRPASVPAYPLLGRLMLCHL